MPANSPILRACLAPLLGMSLLLAACGTGGPDGELASTDINAPPIFHAEGNPEHLSDWNLIDIADGKLALTKGMVAYDLNTPLFTDYAHKLRTVYLPDGTSAKFSDSDTFDFPVGTIISKTFYYPRDGGELTKVSLAADTTDRRLASGFDLGKVRLMETRLLVHRKDGWIALPYVWNEEQTDAVLKRTGAIEQLTLVESDGSEQPFSYVVPNANQCQGCHATNATTKKIQPIGPKARHLNKGFAYRDGEENQLAHWTSLGILAGLPKDSAILPKNALWGDESLPIEDRARSYLDINCAHCHNRNGPADTSGLFLERDTPTGSMIGKCKLPIAAGTGTGNRKYGIVPGKPDDSIFTYRMDSTNPAVMMPELGRSLAHDEGVELISAWIAQMGGNCP